VLALVLIHHLQYYCNLSHINCGHQESQGQAITFGQQMDGASFAFPAIGNILPSFLPGTKLTSRKA
jgi:hypothetical protein